MKYAALVPLIFAAACSSPTAPTPVTVTPPVVVTPPIITPPVAARNPLLDDVRFSLAFYRQIALNGFEHPGALWSLRRFTQSPRIYLRTVTDQGAVVDARTIDQTAATLINAAGEMTGKFGLAGLEQGADSREGQAGWITVRWTITSLDRCGYATAIGVEGGTIELYTNRPNCGCGVYQMAPRTVKHELAHALGFFHTDSRDDLMWGGGWPASQCEMGMNDREKFHARLAYDMPIGSFDPQ